jgi:hypothetical protein
MKILLVGPFSGKQRESAIGEGFRQNGCDVFECSYGDILYSSSLLNRIQLRIGVGLVNFKLVKRVQQAASMFKPDVIFFRRPLEFNESMIADIKKKSNAIFVNYNNDDPFSKAYDANSKWRKYRKTIPLYNITFSFRRKNIAEYLEYGATNAFLWEPSFSPWIHRPLVSREAWIRYNSMILFAMHAERDERRECLLELNRLNYNVHIHSWNWATEFGKLESKLLNVQQPIWEDQYVEKIGNSMATLCFFSKQNNDELTSRVFEIPASLGLLVSKKNERLESIFKNGQDAFLFDSTSELIDILDFLKRNPDRVTKMKVAGYNTIVNGQNSIVDRCEMAIQIFKEFKK